MEHESTLDILKRNIGKADNLTFKDGVIYRNGLLVGFYGEGKSNYGIMQALKHLNEED
jgi:hypothetical protein